MNLAIFDIDGTLSAARASSDGLPFLFWLFTGLRPAEFTGLGWDCISLVEEKGKS